MVNVRKAFFAAMRGDPNLVPKVKHALRERIDEKEGPVATVVQAAEALEPILADAVRKRPSKLGKLGLRSAEVLAGLTMQDSKSNKRLARIAKGSSVGIVFVDISGFTAYTERAGDDAAIALLDRLDRMIEVKVREVQGECVKHLGDGFLLAFPSASQAVRGAVNLTRAVRQKRAADPTFDVTLRVAVHAGEPLIEGDDLLGHDVNLTARLLDHCKPDYVLVSEAAKELAEKRLRSVEFGRRKVVKIRGLSSKVAVYPIKTAA
ncbi:MAG TPA: adenylate/guanylate cyclase domain-containing protein [Actinomycetota bacterium]|nr:adenylate/guanylate cyclase domain-containing protein [Actinomycetota bacterium]